MVLFLFVIMLLNLGNDYQPDIRGKTWLAMGAGSGLVLAALLVRMFSGETAPLGREAGPTALANHVADVGVVNVIGLPLYRDYVVPLQATAILLLIACIGAVVLAKRRF